MIREEIRAYVLDYLAGRMTCKQVVDLVTDYLEGSMSLRTRLRFHLHLGICLGCRTYLKQMKDTIHTLGHLPQEPAPPAVREELLRRFRTWKA